MSVSVYKHNPTGAVLVVVVLVLVLLIISEEEDAGPRSRGNHLELSTDGEELCADEGGGGGNQRQLNRCVRGRQDCWTVG